MVARAEASGKNRSAAVASAAPAKAPVPAVGATLVEATEQQDLAIQVVSRKRCRSIEESVNKAIVDNFKGLSSAQIDLTLVDGMSLRDRLHDAKRRQKAGENITIGKVFYALLRDEFGAASDVGKQLKVANELEPEDDRMKAALMLMLRHNRDTTQIEQWLQNSPLASQKNFVGLCRAFLMIHPSQSIANANLVLEFLRYCNRVRAHEAHRHEWPLLKSHFDLALQKSFAQLKTQGLPCSVWWASVKDFAGLLLPVREVDLVLACKSTWSDVKVPLQIIADSCTMGAKMFASARRQLTENDASHIVQKAVDTLVGLPVTVVAVAKAEHDMRAELLGLGIDPTVGFARRQVEFHYRA